MTTNWHHINKPHLGRLDSWSRWIRDRESAAPSLLPDLRRGSCLIGASDYSGRHKTSRFEVMAFLLCDWEQCREWLRRRAYLRERLLPRRRIMSFKGLHDRMKQDALASFLDAANTIPGIVVAVAVDRSLGPIFAEDREIGWEGPGIETLRDLPGGVLEKLVRTFAFAGLFVSGLSAPAQDLLWFSDEDEIVANEARLRAATTLFANVASHFLNHDLRHLRPGTTKCDDGSLTIEDLAAIPDLAAGAIAELVGKMRQSGRYPEGQVIVPSPADLSIKSRYLAAWLSDSNSALKKLTWILLPRDTGSGFVLHWLDLHRVDSLPSLQLPGVEYRGSIFGNS